MVMSNEPLQMPDGAGGPSSADVVHAAMRFFRVVQRRKLNLVSCLVVSGLLGALYYFTAPRIYEAKAGLRIQRHAPLGSPDKGLQTGQETGVSSEARLIKCGAVLSGALAELSRKPPQSRVDFEGLQSPKSEEKLRRLLEVREIRRTDQVEISYKSKNVHSAKDVLQAIIKAYTDYTERSNKEGRKRDVDVLEKELRDVNSQLDQKERALKVEKEKAQYTGLDTNQKELPANEFDETTTREEFIKAQRERILWEGLLHAVLDGIRCGIDFRNTPKLVESILGRDAMLKRCGSDPVGARIEEQHKLNLSKLQAELTDARRTKGEDHSHVRRLQDEIRLKESDLYALQYDSRLLQEELNNETQSRYENAWDKEDDAGRDYEKARKKSVQRATELASVDKLQREIERLDKQRNSLLDEIKNNGLNENRPQTIVSETDPITASDRPVSPRLSMVGVLCLIAGLGMGMAMIYVQDVLDDRFRSPDELREQLGVPLLAMIRQLCVEAVSGLEALQLHVAPSSVESEGFRTWRAALQFSGRDTARIALSSSEEKAGKSTLTSNLGVSYAHAGKRTLLIDCDLRRPGLTKLFELRARGGLSDILRRSEEIAAMCQSCVVPTGVEKLDVLPSGPKPSNPAELLSGPRLSEVLTWAESKYDQVIVDCPPILAAADAAIVGRLTDGLILVVDPEKNHRRLVIRAVASLATMGVGLVGVVANRVEEKEGDYYGYGDGDGAEEPAETESGEREAEASGADERERSTIAMPARSAEDAEPERHVTPQRPESGTIVRRRAA